MAQLEHGDLPVSSVEHGPHHQAAGASTRPARRGPRPPPRPPPPALAMLSGSGAACPLCPAFCFSPGCLLLLVWWWCGGLWGCGWVGCELYSGREYLCSLWCVFVVCLAPGSCCAVRGVVGSGCGLPVLCVVFMGVRWMPWHQGPMKDVVDCDKPRGAVLRALIRGFPNGGTRRPSRGVTRV